MKLTGKLAAEPSSSFNPVLQVFEARGGGGGGADVGGGNTGKIRSRPTLPSCHDRRHSPYCGGHSEGAKGERQVAWAVWGTWWEEGGEGVDGLSGLPGVLTWGSCHAPSLSPVPVSALPHHASLLMSPVPGGSNLRSSSALDEWLLLGVITTGPSPLSSHSRGQGCVAPSLPSCKPSHASSRPFPPSWLPDPSPQKARPACTSLVPRSVGPCPSLILEMPLESA